MSNMTKRVLSSVAGAALFAAVSVTLTASPAAADPPGCPWPYVCFYKTSASYPNGTPSAMYKDVTSSYQDLGSASRGSDWVFNSRDDDRAMLRYVVNGQTKYHCLAPNSDIGFTSAATVTGIKIQTASTC
ncbi:hypothetical protein [Streptomyces sp. Inha503]|uniref:hypothetical protein n=1 Tax=Streptomyces sp. Inha503 TaxID=3383314 RepID=UPI0039A24293